MENNNNIIKYNRFHLNIGIVIFVFIIIYVLFSVLTYWKTKPVSEYEVTQGTITTNHIYKGLVIRNESIVLSPAEGNINFYNVNGTKAGVNDVICSIDKDGHISKQIEAQKDKDVLNDYSINTISAEIDNIIHQYDLTYFQTVSTGKEELESKIDQSVNNSVFQSLDNNLLSSQGNSFVQVKPKEPGIISYSYDGMEDLSITNFSQENFEMSNYKRTSIEKNNSIKEGEPLYRIINDEHWNVIIQVSSDVAKELSDKKVMKIKFCKDNYETNANFSITSMGNKYFLVFSLNKAMIRYVNDRYLDIELVISEKTGLKIPNSSIVEKNFYKVPVEFLMLGGDSIENGILVHRETEEKSYDEMIFPTIYYSDEDYFYIDNELVTNGDIIKKGESDKTYIIGDDVGSLTGVYNINKGYAVFKQIKVISSNSDYSIVELKTSYGIALYDHIALEGKKIIENQTIKK